MMNKWLSLLFVYVLFESLTAAPVSPRPADDPLSVEHDAFSASERSLFQPVAGVHHSYLASLPEEKETIKIVLANSRMPGSSLWGLPVAEAETACQVYGENEAVYTPTNKHTLAAYSILNRLLGNILGHVSTTKEAKKLEGHLLTIRNSEEMAAVVRLLGSLQTGAYWTGARLIRNSVSNDTLDDGVELTWIDNSPGDLAVLGLTASDVSKLDADKEYCLAIDLRQARWQARLCTDKLAYACILRHVTVPENPETTTASTVEPSLPSSGFSAESSATRRLVPTPAKPVQTAEPSFVTEPSTTTVQPRQQSNRFSIQPESGNPVAPQDEVPAESVTRQMRTTPVATTISASTRSSIPFRVDDRTTGPTVPVPRRRAWITEPTPSFVTEQPTPLDTARHERTRVNAPSAPVWLTTTSRPHNTRPVISQTEFSTDVVENQMTTAEVDTTTGTSPKVAHSSEAEAIAEEFTTTIPLMPPPAELVPTAEPLPSFVTEQSPGTAPLQQERNRFSIQPETMRPIATIPPERVIPATQQEALTTTRPLMPPPAELASTAEALPSFVTEQSPGTGPLRQERNRFNIQPETMWPTATHPPENVAPDTQHEVVSEEVSTSRPIVLTPSTMPPRQERNRFNMRSRVSTSPPENVNPDTQNNETPTDAVAIQMSTAAMDTAIHTSPRNSLPMEADASLDNANSRIVWSPKDSVVRVTDAHPHSATASTNFPESANLADLSVTSIGEMPGRTIADQFAAAVPGKVTAPLADESITQVTPSGIESEASSSKITLGAIESIAVTAATTLPNLFNEWSAPADESVAEPRHPMMWT